ncbi:MAG: manganese efflux pump [Gaiellaceae bacterium]
MLTLLALVAPAGLDALAVAAGLSLTGLDARERRRVLVIFPASEIAMVGAGLALGKGLTGSLAGAADLVAALLLAAVGIGLLLEGGGEVSRTRRLLRGRGLAVLLLGAAVGLDELALGAGAALLGLSWPLVLGLVGAEALVATPAGLALGARTRGFRPDLLERLGGAILLGLGLAVAVEQL